MTVVDHIPPHRTTTELLSAASAGSERSWEALVARFESQINATITSYRLQPADAHDAAQSTWLRAVEHHHRIREPEALGRWLKTIAGRECLRIIRDRKGIAPVAEPETLQPHDSSVDVERTVIDADTARWMRGLVDLLPARSADLLRTLFGDAPPGYAELSRRTGVPIGSIGPTRARAMEKLRRLVECGAEAG